MQKDNNMLKSHIRRHAAAPRGCVMLNILVTSFLALPAIAEEITIIKSESEYNAAAGGDGRIYAPTKTFTFSSGEAFTLAGKNASSTGGVVSAESVNLENSQITFMNNKAGSGGGVVAVERNGSVTITGGTFTDNRADVKGGVVYAAKNGNVTISGGSFVNNKANDNGGVVFTEIGGSVTITGGSFWGNGTAPIVPGADKGGVVFATGSVTITGGTFSDNRASFGGAVATTDNITLTPGEGESVSFTTATDSLYTSGGSKTITINGAGTVDLYSEDNYAGGGIKMESGTLNLGKEGVTNNAVFKSPDSSSNPVQFTMTGGVTNAYTANVFGIEASVTINGGTLTLKAPQKNNIILNSGGVLIADASNVLTDFTQNAGTVNANVADAFGGTTTVNAGGTLNFTDQVSGGIGGTFTGDGSITSSGNISIDTSDTFNGFTGNFVVKGGTVTVDAPDAFGGTVSVNNGGTLTLNATQDISKITNNNSTLNVNAAQNISQNYTLGAGQTLAFAADSVTGDANPVLNADGHTVTLESGSFVVAKIGGELARVEQGTTADYVVINNAAADSTYAADLRHEVTEIGVDSSLFSIKRLNEDDAAQYVVSITRKAVQTALPGMGASTAGLMDSVVQQYGLDTDSSIPAVRFFSRITSTTEGLGNDPRLGAAIVERSMQVAAAGAVPAMTLGAANAGVSAVQTRLSAAPTSATTTAVQGGVAALHTDGNVSQQGRSAGDDMKNGFGLWLMPLYQNNRVWGMSSGSFNSGYTSDLGGLALGADYTEADAYRFGLALHTGGGVTTSNDKSTQTDNYFWGLSLYGSYKWNSALTLSADMGYTSNVSDVKQKLPAALSMGNLKSDVTSHAWMTGLRAEYKKTTPDADITPYAGVRFMRLTTDGYDVDASYGTVFKVKASRQNLWTFPLGVIVGKDFTTESGWTFSPQADAGVIIAAGDVKVKSRTSVLNVNYTAENKMQVVDHTTFSGGLGFTMSNKDLIFGLNYNLQSSKHRIGHGLQATVRYEF